VQANPSHTAARAGSEFSTDPALAVHIGDADELPAFWLDPDVLQLPQSLWHQSFAARLVDGSAASLDDDHFKSRPRSVQRRGKARRAAASDEQVDHVKLSSARFSTLILVRSSAALSAENTNAVIHPE
jgi:hypothetical protein